jgi:hydroxyacylglutathione hydrolase
MSITIHQLSLGKLQTNCYVVRDENTHDAIIIDPSDEAPRILAAVEGYTVREILLTHAHFDHVLASGPVKAATNAPLRIHAADVPQLEHAQQIAMVYGISAPEPATHDHTLNEGDIIEVGNITLETIYTPGHSPGHVCFILRSEKAVFCGDCVFQGSIGRTDLPGANGSELMQSIFDKILPIGDDFRLYPGHGPATTIDTERKRNPFLQR